MKTLKPDVQVVRPHRLATIYVFTAFTRRARTWIRNNISATEREGDGSFVADQRCARDIANGMAGAGLRLTTSTS